MNSSETDSFHVCYYSPRMCIRDGITLTGHGIFLGNPGNIAMNNKSRADLNKRWNELYESDFIANIRLMQVSSKVGDETYDVEESIYYPGILGQCQNLGDRIPSQAL